MKLYKDKDLKEEITNNIFECGIVDIGTTKEYNIYISNTTEGLLQDILFRLEPIKEKYNKEESKIIKEECDILSYPKSMLINETGILKLSWSPSGEVKKGLHVQVFGNSKVIYI